MSQSAQLEMRLQAFHWEIWLLRLLLAGVLAFQVATANAAGAIVAGEGVVVSLLPILIERLSHTRCPRALEFAYVAGMTLQFASESTKLFEVFYYWDKLVHPTLIALTAMIASWLLLGYRDEFGLRMTTHFAAAFGWLVGASIGAFWEFVEFFSDWFGNTDLQKSNGDTMTDMLSNDIGAFVATLIGCWLYCHILGRQQRGEMGQLAHWLSGGPARLLDRHGRLVGSALACLLAVLLAATQWVDRGTPALAADLPPGLSHDWSLATPSADTRVLVGTWQPGGQAGMCRVDLENSEVPKPGSEKMGLLELASGSVYGGGAPAFTVATHYFEQRPAKSQGTQMDAGIAFGIRGDSDFYVLEQSALHDILRLDRYVHGRRRDVREKLARTHGNEWHVLQARVGGDRVSAMLDGQEIFAVSGLPETAGGIGLWARTSAATCFDAVQVHEGDAAFNSPVPDR
ncbi:MAG TPA: hypothetical protein VKV73_02985 [Chloroflexota bacterium]|nr:hypothetical protein [Chloroflexota bacterium]